VGDPAGADRGRSGRRGPWVIRFDRSGVSPECRIGIGLVPVGTLVRPGGVLGDGGVLGGSWVLGGGGALGGGGVPGDSRDRPKRHSATTPRETLAGESPALKHRAALLRGRRAGWFTELLDCVNGWKAPALSARGARCALPSLTAFARCSACVARLRREGGPLRSTRTGHTPPQPIRSLTDSVGSLPHPSRGALGARAPRERAPRRDGGVNPRVVRDSGGREGVLARPADRRATPAVRRRSTRVKAKIAPDPREWRDLPRRGVL
jgi:hypothetical protein